MSILGERYTHGHVYDFVRQLRENPSKLDQASSTAVVTVFAGTAWRRLRNADKRAKDSEP
jgi:hypothetical protein